MANNQKNSLPAPKKSSSSASKKTQSTAPERDPYAYYDELYEKNPRKKKKADEKLPPDDYEKYEKRAANFLNTWNPDCESEGFFNFPQKRNEEGLFDEGFDAHGGYNSSFYVDNLSVTPLAFENYL